jgi:hypothetical protein
MSDQDHELERLRADYARQTDSWNRLKERLSQLPRDLHMAISLPDESSDRPSSGAVSLPPSSGLRG